MAERHAGSMPVSIRVEGLARMVEIASQLADEQAVTEKFRGASEAAARKVAARTRALAVALGHGGSIAAAEHLAVDASAVAAALVMDSAAHPAMIGGLFGAAHDKPRQRTIRVNGADTTQTYKGFNQFPFPFRTPLPWQAFAAERDAVETDFLETLEKIVEEVTERTR